MGVNSTKHRWLTLTLVIFNAILSLCAIPLIGVGFYLKENVAVYTYFTDSPYNVTFRNMLFATGMLLMCIHSLGAALFWIARTAKSSSTITCPIGVYVVIVFVFVWVMLATAIIGFKQTASMRTNFASGFRLAMAAYNSTEKAKERVDVLQAAHQCCGLANYTDWFEVAWHNSKYLDVFEVGKIYQVRSYGQQLLVLLDSVPFSCCNVSSPRPCRHTALLGAFTIKPAAVRDLTVYRRGCHDVVTRSTVFVFLPNFAIFLIVLFGLLWVVILLSSVVQLSLGQGSDAGGDQGGGQMKEKEAKKQGAKKPGKVTKKLAFGRKGRRK